MGRTGAEDGCAWIDRPFGLETDLMMKAARRTEYDVIRKEMVLCVETSAGQRLDCPAGTESLTRSGHWREQKVRSRQIRW